MIKNIQASSPFKRGLYSTNYAAYATLPASIGTLFTLPQAGNSMAILNPSFEIIYKLIAHRAEWIKEQIEAMDVLGTIYNDI